MAYTQKTVPTDASVKDFVDAIADDRRREEARRLLRILERACGERPRMWGDSIIGFGEYHYRHPGGQEGFWFLTGFAPRKAAQTIYVMPGFEEWPDLTQRLGRFTTSRSCLYVKRLEHVDEDVLEELLHRSVNLMRERYPAPGKSAGTPPGLTEARQNPRRSRSGRPGCRYPPRVSGRR